MNIAGRSAIVTGGGGGIGGALAERLANEGARVLIADLDADAAASVASRINEQRPGAAVAFEADVSDAAQIRAMIERADVAFGPLDLYIANAGVGGAFGLGEDEGDWDAAIDVNLRAHVRAARVLVPRWLARGGGYFVSTASAAGLLTQIGSAPYAVTKHAAVAFAEWLSITYGERGVRVSCLCPMGVDTKMLHGRPDIDDPVGVAANRAVTSAGDVLSPAEVAGAVIEGIQDERFLILPHGDVLRMFQQKSSDYERWLRGMRRYQASMLEFAK